MITLSVVLTAGLVVLSGCAGRPQPARTVTLQCPLTDSDARWIQNVLDSWARASRDFLEIDPHPLPKTVLFNSTCVWYLALAAGEPPGSARVDTPLRLAGRPVPVQWLTHDGTIVLPDGGTIQAGIIAVAMPHRGGDDAYLVLALPEVWRRHPHASQDPHLGIRIPSAALHEMVHTRQLPDLRRLVKALGDRFDLPARFDDDVVEQRFENSAAYRTMFVAERDLLFDAIVETDMGRSTALVSEALSIAQRRRERFFVGDDEMYADLEDLFLNMEGIAEWVRFKHHQADPSWPTADAEIIDFLRGQENSWSQDEGLALTLLLDRMVPGWKGHIFNSEMPSPLATLRRAITSGRTMSRHSN